MTWTLVAVRMEIRKRRNAEKVLSDKALSLIYISVGYKVKLSNILPSQSSFTEEM